MPLLVFTQYRAEASYLGERYPDATVGLPDSLDAWSAGDIPMLCVHPMSCSHGLNLQYGSHIGVYYSMPTSHDQWFQSWGRLHRRGQPHQVSIVRLERENSIEQDIYDMVLAKDDRLETFLKRMRARRKAFA